MRPTPGPTDDDLMLDAVRGDRAAFERIAERHGDRLMGFFVRLGLDRHAAEDCVQEVFVRLLRAPSYEPRARFDAWLFTLARHVLVDQDRRRRARPLELVSPGELELEHDRDVSEPRDDLAAALARLSPKHRLVVEMAVHQGLRYREIADVLGCPVGTVKSRMHHALHHLRRLMEPDRVH